MARRPRKSTLRLVLILLAVVVLAPLAAALGAWVLFDPNAWRPEVEAAVQQATGRTLRIGRLTLVPALSPTLGAADVALANLPGGSRPDMITIARAEARLALLPLLLGRVEIANLLLVRPDILLEHNAAGQANWKFAPRPADAASSPAGTSPATGAAGVPAVLVRSLRIEDGSLAVRGRDAKVPAQLDVRVLAADAKGLDGPVTVTAQGAWAGQTLAFTAETGSLSHLLSDAAGTPWPVKAMLETPGARLALAGTLAQPRTGAGYALAVEGAAVNLSALDALLGVHLPPLRQVAFGAHVADSGRMPPEVTGIVVRAGASDLDGLVPGLKLVHGELSAGALGEPLRAEAVGSLQGAGLHVTASLGPIAALLPGAPNAGPYPVELAAEAEGATLAVRGGVASPFRATGIDLAVTGRIPDLSALGRLAGVRLPALRPVTLDARVADRADMPGFAVRGLAVTSPEADVSGEVLVGLGPLPAVQATLSSRRIDLDAVLAALPAAARPAAASPTPASPPPRAAARPARLIPDEKLPFALLDAANADLRVSIGELRSLGAVYRDLSGRLVVQDGKLALDPFSGTLPGGRLDVRLTVDSRATPPPVALTVHGPGLSLKPLMAALRLPDDITGSAEIDADLHGTGDTPRALAAGLGGRLGLAMADGELDNRLLGSTIGAVLAGVQLTAAQQLAGAQVPTEQLGLDRPGRTRIRCLALRADAEAGMVNVSTLLLDTGRILVHGTGTLNLPDEGIALRLRPTLRVGPSLVLPIRVGGTFAEPKFGSDTAASLGAAAGFLAGLPGARGTPLGALAPAEHGDSCTPALAAARSGPRPAPAPTQAGPKPPNPGDLLRGLLSR